MSVTMEPRFRRPPIIPPPRADIGRRAVVTCASVKADIIAEFFPGWERVTPGASVIGRRYARIVMLWRPENNWQRDWTEALFRCLPPNHDPEWMV